MANPDIFPPGPVIDPSGLTPDEIAAVMNKDLVGLTWTEIAERYGEDVAISAGILFDYDAFVPTEEEWNRARPAKEIVPDLVKASHSGRPLRAKVHVEITLDDDILRYFQQTGPDWKTTLNDTLRQTVFGPAEKP